MRIAFTSYDGGFDADDYALIVGVEGDGHYLTLQRDAEESGEPDWGIHFEYDDQSNGGYQCIAACRLGPDTLFVDLSRQLGQLVGVTGFDVTLRLDPDQLSAVREGLKRVFRGHLDMLADSESDHSPDHVGRQVAPE